MTGPGRPSRNQWKRRMGVEFSGLERSSDFWFAIALVAAIVIVAMVIAFVAYG